MLNFLDVYERTLDGPVISEKEFNMKVFVPTVRDVVKKYDIKLDTDNPVATDDAAADNLFHAGVELLSRVGLYCMDSNRIVRFTEEEIRKELAEASGECHVGEGKDARVYGMRVPDDPKRPWFHGGWSWICTSEEIATNQLEALASLPYADSLKIPVIKTLRGIPFSGGSPGEMYAAIRQIRIGREAAKRAGRPGMPIMNLVGQASAAVTTIGASAPQFGARPTDGWIVGIIAEMKTDFDIMNKLAYLLAWGANIGAESAPILGGWCGGPEGTAVVNVADIILGIVGYKSNYHLTFPIDSRLGCATTRGILAVVSAASQACSRNVRVPVNWLCYTAAGVNTRMYFHEAAAYLLTSVTGGTASVGIPHPAKGVKVDASTPMEAKFGIEVSRAAAKLNRDKARELVPKLVAKYESDLANAPEGETYQDCYDVETGKPHEDYVRLYDDVVDELTKMGIPFE